MDTPKNTSKKDEINARRLQVQTLRLAHYTQTEIAQRLDVSVGTVNGDLKAIREEWVARRDENYGSWVAEELAKLDALERTWLPKALARDGDDKAVSRVLQIMERRSRMLGLDQPEKFLHQVVTVDMIDAEIVRLERELQAAAAEDMFELPAGDVEDNE